MSKQCQIIVAERALAIITESTDPLQSRETGTAFSVVLQGSFSPILVLFLSARFDRENRDSFEGCALPGPHYP